jgi:hypothetical protein
MHWPDSNGLIRSGRPSYSQTLPPSRSALVGRIISQVTSHNPRLVDASSRSTQMTPFLKTVLRRVGLSYTPGCLKACLFIEAITTSEFVRKTDEVSCQYRARDQLITPNFFRS